MVAITGDPELSDEELMQYRNLWAPPWGAKTST